ncbi:MAG: FecR domain-containing protein [Candidatus Eremiobacteraeota bacterium]|nr:FecR domain-containing protein [Candidatus Eremiobacteraeota bacterium]
MRSPNRWSILPAVIASSALSLVAIGIVHASALADDVGVARISVLSGSVTLKRADSGDSVAAAINAPVNAGDYLVTSDGARAEVQFDGSDVVRMDSDAQARFTSVEGPANSLQLAQGTVEVKSLARSAGQPSVQTPSATIRGDAPGRYRVAVDDQGDTLLAVRSGSADVIGAQGTQTFTAGTTVQISGSAPNVQVTPVSNLTVDAFDSWNGQRDQYLAAVSDDPYADSGITGLADLDTYGHWVSYPQYGQVWVANSYPAGWAPYQYGHWVWQPYYGWTWVGYEPWGWAPYHYGRWFWAANTGWAWYPGPFYVRPVYRPALVAFFGYGGGGGFSFSFAAGNVGWVPLAPYEVYHPWWGPAFVNHTTVVYNYTNVTNVTNVNITKYYRNATVPGGVAVVGHEQFVNGEPYKYQSVTPGELHNVSLVRSALPVVPTKQNLAFTTSGHAGATPPLSSRFATLPAPSKVPPTFAQQRAVVTSVTQHIYPSGVVNAAAHNPGGSGATVSSPWDRFNTGNGAAAGTTNGKKPLYTGTSTYNGASGNHNGATGGTSSGSANPGSMNSGGSSNNHKNAKAPKHPSKPKGGNGSSGGGQGNGGKGSGGKNGNAGNGKPG